MNYSQLTACKFNCFSRSAFLCSSTDFKPHQGTDSLPTCTFPFSFLLLLFPIVILRMLWLTYTLYFKLPFLKFIIILNIFIFFAPLSSMMYSRPTFTTVMATHEDLRDEPTHTSNLADAAASWQRQEWLNNPEQLLVPAGILSRALERTHRLVTNPPLSHSHWHMWQSSNKGLTALILLTETITLFHRSTRHAQSAKLSNTSWLPSLDMGTTSWGATRLHQTGSLPVPATPVSQH